VGDGVSDNLSRLTEQLEHLTSDEERAYLNMMLGSLSVQCTAAQWTAAMRWAADEVERQRRLAGRPAG
jgi:hypothetical protein